MRIFLRAILGIVGVAATAFILAEPSETIAQVAPKESARSPMTVAAEIDRLIDARLAEAKLLASPQTDDAEFLRRASLDLCGRIPSAERVTAFLADSDPNKRSRAINELLDDREYGEHFAIIWYHRMVRPDDDNRLLISPKLQEWLAKRFNENAGWDRIVKDILTASGDRDEHPETVFWLANVSDKKGQPQPSKITGASSRLFLGVRLECAECHNHPFTTLKQEDFWGVAAFFTNTHGENSTKKAAKNGSTPVIREGAFKGKGGKGAKKKGKAMDSAPFGSITIPDTKGKTVKACVLGSKPVPLTGQPALRPLFADWVTSPNNPYFARAAVNKVWANFFGRGIVDPVDDMRPEAKPTHPDILKLLSEEFIASGFDLKHLARCIANSRTYQRASRSIPSNKEDDQLYSRMRVKVMTADMLFDSLGVALGHAAADKETGKGKKKAQKRKRAGTVRDQFRKFFHAEVDDDVGVAEDYTHGIPQALRLMNARQINDTSSAVTQAMKAGGAPEKIVEILYLRVLSRRPTEAEVKRMKEYAAGDKDQTRAYGDILWVLLNSGEFVLNH